MHQKKTTSQCKQFSIKVRFSLARNGINKPVQALKVVCIAFQCKCKQCRVDKTFYSHQSAHTYTHYYNTTHRCLCRDGNDQSNISIVFWSRHNSLIIYRTDVTRPCVDPNCAVRCFSQPPGYMPGSTSAAASKYYSRTSETPHEVIRLS